MSKEIKLEKLNKIFKEVFPNMEENISLETQKEDIPEWDSLGHLNLFMAIEHNFKISFTIEEIANINSVKDILNLVTI